MSNGKRSILSVDVGGSTCKIGVVLTDGTIREDTHLPTERIRSGGVDELLSRLDPFRRNHSLDGIALALPATVDWEHNHVRSRCMEVPWFEDVTSKKRLQDELHRPVLLVNDAEALMMGEWRWGELKGLNSGVVVSLGASMGSALLWNSQPQQGRRGSIMELEHVSLDTYGESDGDFPPGSSRRWLSGRGLKDRMRSRQLDVLSLEEFFRATDEPYREIRDSFIDRLAHLLGTVVMMLDPERIVLAGGITRSHKQWLPQVQDRMNRFVMEQFQGVPAVVLGQLRGQEVLRGPAAFWDWVHS